MEKVKYIMISSFKVKEKQLPDLRFCLYVSRYYNCLCKVAPFICPVTNKMAKKTLNEDEILSLLFNEQDTDNDFKKLFIDCSDDDDNSDNDNNSDNDSNTEDNVTLSQQIKRRKVLTNKRIINSLDASLNSDNYNSVIFDNEIEQFKKIMDKPTKKKEGKIVCWTNERPSTSGRQSAENIIKNRPETIITKSSTDTQLDCWKLFMTSKMIEDIVRYTNIQISKKISAIDQNILNKDYFTYVKLTNAVEIMSFIGLMYARGLFNLSQQNHRYLFKEGVGHAIFGATMSVNRFSFLNSNIKFDNINTREERFPHDRFSAIRELFEKFNKRCSSVLQPDEFLAIDETLYPCRNQISFK